MVILLIIIGAIIFAFGMFAAHLQRQNTNKAVIENEEFVYLQKRQKREIAENSHSFIEQFELTQQQLENLYAQDFSDIYKKVEVVDKRLQRLEQQLSHVDNQLGTLKESQLMQETLTQQLKLLTEKLSKPTLLEVDNETVVAPNINLNADMARKLEQLKQLEQDGFKTEEIAKTLQMGKGEVLLLRNLLKK
ncbi:MAG TPA: hypothetical protein DCY20_03295 [Firmicutes bacterium]|nr:hypothetical protein [Bacillota bacterium]